MSIYRKIWEEHNNACILPGMHIHHIDGNRENNNPFNLKLCTPMEHYTIHYEQGDYGAATLLWMNFLHREVDSDAPSRRMKRTHIEMKERDPAAYSEWQRKRSLGKRRTEEQKKNYRNSAKKRWADPESRTIHSELCKGKRKIVICPHCGKSGGGGNMKRYHFDNCKRGNDR